ncbi:hypothetical protein D3C84_1085170 [compost metagenome]
MRGTILPKPIHKKGLPHPSPPDRNKDKDEFAQILKRDCAMVHMQQDVTRFGNRRNKK